jgi:hypothetical protein
MEKATEQEFRDFINLVKPPAGFNIKINNESWGKETWLGFSVTGPGVEIQFDQHGSGHTRFQTDKGAWLSFDRRGVEDSFYWKPLDKDTRETDPNKIIAEQLERIAKRQEYYRSAVSIPGIPFTVTPDGIEDLKKRLTKDGSVSFMPSGFGTGYVVTRRKPKVLKYGNKRAAPETEKFFGQAPLYITTFDAD